MQDLKLAKCELDPRAEGRITYLHKEKGLLKYIEYYEYLNFRYSGDRNTFTNNLC